MGPDNINSYMLKLALPYVVESSTYVYNYCIQQNIFPPAVKAAKVISLLKAKDLSDPNNFRAISLLFNLTKSLERHFHKHLAQFIEDRNLFHPFQSSFRQRHSCHTALIRVFDTWLAAISQAQIIAEEQAGFRVGRSTTEQIFNLRILCGEISPAPARPLPCLHRLQEGLRQGLACSFVGNHEVVQHQHKPYPSHQKPL